ncbi:MAG: serine protease, partial [Proteobacteria bacterium]|nr:serine protease [Pseudomonadota bacterium]
YTFFYIWGGAMKVLFATRIVFLSYFSCFGVVCAGERVIYDEDNRKDVYDPTNDDDLLRFAKSTAILIEDEKLVRNKDRGKPVGLPRETFGEAQSLCSSEPFAEQINPGFCSGFLVGPDLFATAGHCIDSKSICSNTSIIFDFSLENEHQDLGTVPESNVFHCKSIVKVIKDPTESGADFAIIKLDRLVVGRTPLAIRRTGGIDAGIPIAVIGNPSGLPTKISEGAKVRKNDPKVPFFVANLDTYGGNSGSAVFNMVTGEVEGILVRGENDFDFDANNSCYKSHHCTDSGCRGEDVIKAEVFKKWIPQ